MAFVRWKGAVAPVILTHPLYELKCSGATDVYGIGSMLWDLRTLIQRHEFRHVMSQSGPTF